MFLIHVVALSQCKYTVLFLRFVFLAESGKKKKKKKKSEVIEFEVRPDDSFSGSFVKAETNSEKKKKKKRKSLGDQED
jgi:anionic cell wall polymer biosynthesis LytR-Cps2A-Psr (LCP) family protein